MGRRRDWLWRAGVVVALPAVVVAVAMTDRDGDGGAVPDTTVPEPSVVVTETTAAPTQTSDSPAQVGAAVQDDERPVQTQPEPEPGPALAVSSDGRRLVDRDGSPVFLLADTNWGLLSLTRSEVVTYLTTRKQQGFNTIIGPNIYGEADIESRTPVRVDNLTDGGSHLYEHLDFVVATARDLDLYLVMTLNWGTSRRMSSYGSPDVAVDYARFVSQRYAGESHIIWNVVGEYTFERGAGQRARWLPYWEQMGAAIDEIVGDRNLITVHPHALRGFDLASSSAHFHESEWLDVNSVQTWTNEDYAYRRILEDLALTPQKPSWVMEVKYEGSDELGSPVDVRRLTWWAALSGSVGVGYGHESVFGGVREVSWSELQSALQSPGARHLQLLAALMEELFAIDPSYAAADECVLDTGQGARRIQVARSANEAWLAAYVPAGASLDLLPSCLVGATSVRWYDPRTGESVQVPGSGLGAAPPDASDWVLVASASS